MPHLLRAALLLAVLLPTPGAAAMFAFSGTVATVLDTSHFLDASVAAGNGAAGTYTVDPTSASASSPFAVGAAQISFQLGDYQLTVSQDPSTIALIHDTGPPVAPVDLWQSGVFTASDLSPATQSSGNFAGYSVQIEFFDNTASKLTGTETAPFVPPDLLGWSQARLLLDSLARNPDGSTSPDGRVQVQVNLDSWSVVPEPRSSALLTLGLALLAVCAHRRVGSPREGSRGRL